MYGVWKTLLTNCIYNNLEVPNSTIFDSVMWELGFHEWYKHKAIKESYLWRIFIKYIKYWTMVWLLQWNGSTDTKLQIWSKFPHRKQLVSAMMANSM